MRTSELYAPTLREVPAEAEIISNQLLLRAGFIRKSAAGIYTYLPLGLRVLAKIKAIVREEMDAAGGQEIALPIIQPAEMWQESGRWDVYGDEMFRLKDRHERQFCLGPTHEEIITVLVKNDVSSYKQLPLLLYQIENKYRDERRPRFGLIRGREFIMKDLYSFDRDQAGLDRSYEKMYRAYDNVFRRCGLSFRVVEADSGAIGGNYSHEFMAVANVGEGMIVYCPACDYAANIEIAVVAKAPAGEPDPDLFLPLEEVATPGQKTVKDVCAQMSLTPERLIKTIFYEADGQLVAAMVRGDRELNELKLQRHLNCRELKMAGSEIVEKTTGSPPGYVGPVGLTGVTLLADLEVPGMINAVTGANREGYHIRNVNYGRDYQPDAILELRQAEEGDPCPRCGVPLEKTSGIEVGQIFQLGTKYSRAMKANFTDEEGKEQPFVMGCYGIGISRTMAAVVEQHHDDKGMVWPLSVAPYQVIVIPASLRDDRQRQAAEAIYNELRAYDIEIVLDDRDERTGIKFVEADLIGYPLRLTVGKKTLEQGTVDVKWRYEEEDRPAAIDGLATTIQEMLTLEMKKYR